MTWMITNLGTIIVALTLIAIVAVIIFRIAKNKKAGKSSCGCGCENCAMRGQCHK